MKELEIRFWAGFKSKILTKITFVTEINPINEHSCAYDSNEKSTKQILVKNKTQNSDSRSAGKARFGILFLGL
jgi:hypothetical protein